MRSAQALPAVPPAAPATINMNAPAMNANSDTASRGQVIGSSQANTLTASKTTAAIATPLRHPLQATRNAFTDSATGPSALRKGDSPIATAARALKISAPLAVAGNPHDAQLVAFASFPLSHAKQRQR